MAPRSSDGPAARLPCLTRPVSLTGPICVVDPAFVESLGSYSSIPLSLSLIMKLSPALNEVNLDFHLVRAR